MTAQCSHEWSVRNTNHATCSCGKRKSHYYGWHKPKNGLKITKPYTSSIVVSVIPDVIDNSPFCPPVWDQGGQGSCTGFSSASAVTYCRMLQEELTNPPNDSDRASPEFIYTCTRLAEGNKMLADTGASISDTVHTIMTLGSAPEKDMPYNQNIYNQIPTPIAYADALKIHGLDASVIYGNDVALIDDALANGFTVLIGITVCSSFESQATSQTGDIPLPALNPDGSINEMVLGGHAIQITGKKPDPTNPAKRLYNFKNSWGTSWGNKGYGTLPEDYLKNPNLSDDWHVIKLMN